MSKLDENLVVDLTEDWELQDVLVKCLLDTKVFCKTLYPNIFRRDFCKVHDEIFEILDDESIQQAVMIAPRGFGKTSILRAFAAKRILFRISKYIVALSHGSEAAIEQSDNLKMALLENNIVKKLFGSIGHKSAETDFAKKRWVASLPDDKGKGWSGTCVLPRGRGQQVRGLNWGEDSNRPDLLLLDDLYKDEKDVGNELIRAEEKRWFDGSLMGCIPEGEDEWWRALMIGTPIHEDDLLAMAFENPDWEHIQLSACDDNYKSYWPSFMSDERIQKLVGSARLNGTLDVFYRERMCKIISTEDASFKQDYFKYINDPMAIINDQNIEKVVIVDPAKTVKLQSAESGIVCIGIDMVSNKLSIVDCLGEKLYPASNEEEGDKGLYDTAIQMAIKCRANIIAVEVTSLNEFIEQPFKNELNRSGVHHIEFKPLKAIGDKERRVKALVPYYRKGLILHNKACCAGLEGQLLSFPKSKRWDLMDAVAYIVKLLEEGERYMEPTGDNKYPEYEDVNATYAELENEPALEDGAWMIG